MTTGFPLYRLPQKAVSNVLRCMDSIDSFLFSLCSQRCERSVGRLNSKVFRFVVAFQGFHIGMFIEFDDTSVVHVAVLPHTWMSQRLDMEAAQDYRVSYYPPARKGVNFEKPVGGVEEQWMQNLVEEEAESVVLRELNRLDRWPQKQTFDFSALSFKSWYYHCKKIYHLKCITTFIFNNISFAIDMKQIARVLGGIKIGTLMPISQPPEALQQILALRLPYHMIWLDTHSFANSLSLQKTMIENIACAQIEGDEPADAFSVTLDDLLVASAEELTLGLPNISNKGLNQFLKCWMRGSNSRLKVLRMNYPCDYVFSEPIIMRNISHVKMSWPDLREKLMEHDYDQDPDEEAPHICNVLGLHGREATFTFGQTEHGPVCQFYVWNRMCSSFH